jgi:metal-responsive CopG/Arc/MetJ family transcriptional regulator
MRVEVDLGESQLQALDELSKAEKKSRDSLISQALEEYLSRQVAPLDKSAFGLWGDRKIDGLAYQERLRSEW